MSKTYGAVPSCIKYDTSCFCAQLGSISSFSPLGLAHHIHQGTKSVISEVSGSAVTYDVASKYVLHVSFLEFPEVSVAVYTMEPWFVGDS
jgi:hypothetical protein